MKKKQDQQFIQPNSNADQKYNDAVEIAGSVFRLVEKHTTPPNPQNYDMWYSYIEGENPKLKKQIDAVIQQDGILSTFTADQIFEDCIASKRNHNQAHEDVAKKMSAACKALMDMLDSHINVNDGFENSLVSANNKLKAEPTPENLKEVVGTLLQENQRMHRSTKKLSNKLDDSKKQLDHLANNLAQVKKSGLLDPLTLIGNRKHFDQELNKNLTVAQQEGKKFSLILADLDHFKKVNDNFGHLVGDAILKVFANVMKKNVKGRDIVSRYGGEEFAIILPNTETDGAIKVAELVRKDIESQELQVTKNGTALGTITASFGVSQFENGDDSTAIITRTDQKLYSAKGDGRNRVAA